VGYGKHPKGVAPAAIKGLGRERGNPGMGKKTKHLIRKKPQKILGGLGRRHVEAKRPETIRETSNPEGY